MKILSYNIRRGGTGRERQIAAVINAQAPDIAVLQEATRPDVIARLASETGLIHTAATRGRSVAVMSRRPIASHRWVRPRWSQHAFLEIEPQDADVCIVGVHLSAVHAAWTEIRRVRELRSLLHAVRRLDGRCHVLIGDFNTLAPDERLDVNRLPYRLRALVWLSGGRIRWQTIAIMLGAGYADGFRLHNPAVPGYTFATWDPHVRLDYAFVPKGFADRLVGCAVVSDPPDVRLASDHLPLAAEIACSRR